MWIYLKWSDDELRAKDSSRTHSNARSQIRSHKLLFLALGVDSRASRQNGDNNADLWQKKKWLFETPVTVGSIYWRSDIMRTLRRDTTPDAGSRDILIEYIVCWEGTISCFIYNRGIQEGTSGAFLSLFQTPVQRAIHRDTRLAKLTTELTLHPFHTVWVENLCIYISQWCAQGGQQGQSPLLVAQLLKNVR